MNSINFDQGNAGTQFQDLRRSHGPYEPSIASSASSSQYSVFSDSASVQSSIASSISDDFRGSQEDPRDRYCAIAQLQSQAEAVSQLSQPCRQQPSYADVTSVPSEQRQHPRRCSLARNQRPPPLVRQAERKLTFVDNLVDSATLMVEVIWPLSTVPCQGKGSSGRSVLPLRTYIEETLRRSRTSYSTLQVALYYLILIKAFVPHRDFTMEQSGDCPASRALMCGRRMFLAALILASKYLQDRNYSTKAWSKMSGLKVAEINSNERTFLAKIGWKLHVAKPLFDRWTDIVLKYQTMPPSGPSGHGIAAIEELCWKRLVPMLTPELDNVPLPERMVKVVTQPVFSPEISSPATPTPMRSAMKPVHIDSPYEETTPTPATICPPRLLEPQQALNPPTLPRLGPLPTPQMTPSTCALNTPAASVFGSRRPSICSAMAAAYRNGLNRCTTDDYPFAGLDKYRSSRRPSISSSLSLGSSPESMMSDHTRSSRASSISSVATVSSTASCVAPPRVNLARLATTRNARLPMPSVIDVDEPKENQGTATKPIIIGEEDDVVELSPPDFSISEKKMHATHRHSKYQQQPMSVPSTAKSRKRNRLSRGNRRSDLYDEVRYQLEEDVEMIDLVDSDDDVASPSPAATQASNMLRRENTPCFYKEPQPPA